jgi:hypothetical protein
MILVRKHAMLGLKFVCGISVVSRTISVPIANYTSIIALGENEILSITSRSVVVALTQATIDDDTSLSSDQKSIVYANLSVGTEHVCAVSL